MHPNCYENMCHTRGPSRCVPEDAQSGVISQPDNCTFCATASKYKACGWEFPTWMALSHRRTYCAEAFEPNPSLSRQLHRSARSLVTRGLAPHIFVHNASAFASRDGEAQFGLDTNFTTGSSLILDKRVMGADGRPGRGKAVGSHQIKVRTIDAVRYLRSLPRHLHVALKIDVEGVEFELLRDLIASGALCDHVDNLWVEWHGSSRVNYRTLGLPVKEDQLVRMYSWMFFTFQGRKIGFPHQLSPHCRTILMQWA